MFSRWAIAPFAVLSFVLLGGAVASGQTVNGLSASVNPNPPRTEADFILQQLQSDDAGLREGLARIKVLTDAGVRVYPKWLITLFEKGRFEDVEAIALKGIVNSADQASGIPELQKYRVRALLEQHKADEALSAARAFYNVAPLKDTEAAVKLVTLCLTAKNPDDLDTLRRFKRQQVEWSTATTQPAATNELGENVLKSIPVPAEPFASAAASILKRDYVGLMGKGNLLLLANQTADARKAFEAAEMIADKPEQATAAVEGIARAVRADAGALGPANTFIVARQNGQ